MGRQLLCLSHSGLSQSVFLVPAQRMFIFSSHEVWLQGRLMHYMESKSNRDVMVRTLPLVTRWVVALLVDGHLTAHHSKRLEQAKRAFGWPALNARKVLYYGSIPALIYQGKLGLSGTTKRDEAIKQCLQQNLVIDASARQLLASFITGSTKHILAPLEQLMDSVVGEKEGQVVRWVPFHMMEVLRDFAPRVSFGPLLLEIVQVRLLLFSWPIPFHPHITSFLSTSSVPSGSQATPGKPYFLQHCLFVRFRISLMSASLISAETLLGPQCQQTRHWTPSTMFRRRLRNLCATSPSQLFCPTSAFTCLSTPGSWGWMQLSPLGTALGRVVCTATSSRRETALRTRAGTREISRRALWSVAPPIVEAPLVAGSLRARSNSMHSLVCLALSGRLSTGPHWSSFKSERD